MTASGQDLKDNVSVELAEVSKSIQVTYSWGPGSGPNKLGLGSSFFCGVESRAGYSVKRVPGNP